MKNQLFFIVFFVTTVIRVPYCIGQSNVVFYGANASSIGVSFVDTNLTESVKSTIVADLRVCLSEWGKNGELRLRNKEASAGYIDNPSRSPYFPENIDFPENIVSNGTSGIALQIPKSLSDAYTNAFAFAVANSNIAAAANEFVAFLSSSNFVAISSNALPNYVMQKNMSTNDIIETAHEIISDLRKQTYYPPSFLGYYYSPKGPSASNLWLRVPCSTHSPLGTDWHSFPALWHEGKWRFCIWENWVQ